MRAAKQNGDTAQRPIANLVGRLSAQFRIAIEDITTNLMKTTASYVLQENGKAVTGPDLTVKLNGLTMPNPFVIGSGEDCCRLYETTIVCRISHSHVAFIQCKFVLPACNRSPGH